MHRQQVELQMEHFPTREVWLHERVKGLGGSDIHAAVTGEGSYDMWLKKTGKVSPLDDEQSKDETMEWGSYQELAITPWYADKRVNVPGAECVVYDNALMRHPELPVHASPDVLVFAGNEQASDCIRGADAKNVSNEYNADEWGRPGTDEMPERAIMQGVAYCAVLDVERWDFVPCLFGRPPVLFTVWRNSDAEDEILGMAADWWSHHVVKRNAPEPDGSDRTTKTIRKLLAAQTSTSMLPRTPELEYLARRAAAAKAALKRAKAEEAAASNACRIATGTAAAGVEGLWTYKQNVAGTRSLKVKIKETNVA